MNFLPILDATESIKAKIRTLRNQEEVRKYMYTSHEISEVEHNSWLESLQGNPRQNVFVVMLDDEPSGVVSLNAINFNHKTADWAFYIDGALQGKGVGSRIEFWMLDYAFGEAGLEKLNCEVLETNPSVIKMHKKFGFSVEGVRRKNISKDGQRIDVFLLGITSSEWQAHRSKMLKTIERLSR
ncbi:Spermidine N(1)-acetyltransferase [compost metagenome]